jgi:hypothetical protein
MSYLNVIHNNFVTVVLSIIKDLFQICRYSIVSIFILYFEVKKFPKILITSD